MWDAPKKVKWEYKSFPLLSLQLTLIRQRGNACKKVKWEGKEISSMWDARKKVKQEYKSFPLHNKNGPHRRIFSLLFCQNDICILQYICKKHAYLLCNFQICKNLYSMSKSLHHFYCLSILSIKQNTKSYQILKQKLLKYWRKLISRILEFLFFQLFLNFQNSCY